MSEEVVLYRSFLKRLPLTLLVAMVVWLLLRPVLDTAISGFAQLLIRSFEYPRVTRLVVEDHRAEVRRTDFRTDSGIPSIPLTEKHFNTIVLLALYLALPKPFSRRQLERLFMGWCILYLTEHEPVLSRQMSLRPLARRMEPAELLGFLARFLRVLALLHRSSRTVLLPVPDLAWVQLGSRHPAARAADRRRRRNVDYGQEKEIEKLTRGGYRFRRRDR